MELDVISSSVGWVSFDWTCFGRLPCQGMGQSAPHLAAVEPAEPELRTPRKADWPVAPHTPRRPRSPSPEDETLSVSTCAPSGMLAEEPAQAVAAATRAVPLARAQSKVVELYVQRQRREASRQHTPLHQRRKCHSLSCGGPLNSCRGPLNIVHLHWSSGVQATPRGRLQKEGPLVQPLHETTPPARQPMGEAISFEPLREEDDEIAIEAPGETQWRWVQARRREPWGPRLQRSGTYKDRL